jgi:cytochrome P450
MAAVKHSIGEFVRQARSRISEPSGTAQDSRARNFLEAMLFAQAESNSLLGDREVLGNIFTMLLAGEDTTANTLAWAIHFMTLHPEVQARMQLEADAVLGAADVLQEYREAAGLAYIEAVIHETSRLKSVVPLSFFEPTRDVVIGDVRVPTGTPIVLCTRYASLQNEHFEAAAEFQPERWRSANTSPVPGRSAFVPFGFGPRLCPGRNLAILEMQAALSMVCKNFRVRACPGQAPVGEAFSFTLVPTNLFIQLEERAA